MDGVDAGNPFPGELSIEREFLLFARHKAVADGAGDADTGPARHVPDARGSSPSGRALELE
jgi:hypothetical protein